MNPFTDDDDDDGLSGLGIDIFAAIKSAVGTSEVQKAWSQVKSPLPAITGIPGVSKPVLPSWLTQFGTPISTLAKAVVAKARAQPTTAPATHPATGDPLVPSAGGVGRAVTSAATSPYVWAALGLAGLGVFLAARRR